LIWFGLTKVSPSGVSFPSSSMTSTDVPPSTGTSVVDDAVSPDRASPKIVMTSPGASGFCGSKSAALTAAAVL
jgi:hypothetical protein